MEIATLSYRTQTTGVMLIADMRGSKVTSSMHVKRGIMMWAGAFPCKLKRIFVVSDGAILQGVLSMALGFLDAKIRDRVTVLSADQVDSIAVEISATVLPTSLGGCIDMDSEWPIQTEQWLQRESNT